MAKVYVTRQLPPGGLAKLEKEHQVDVNPRQRPLTREELLETVRHYDAVICLLSDTIDARVMKPPGRVQIFANYAVGRQHRRRRSPGGRHMSATPGRAPKPPQIWRGR